MSEFEKRFALLCATAAFVGIGYLTKQKRLRRQTEQPAEDKPDDKVDDAKEAKQVEDTDSKDEGTSPSDPRGTITAATSNPTIMKPEITKKALPSRVVLVTGGTGLIGRALQAMVEEERQTHPESFINETWVFVGRKDGRLGYRAETEALFRRFHPTHVIHLAAVGGSIYKNLKHPIGTWQKNMDMNENVMRCSQQFKVEKLISCLCTSMFPEVVTYPIDESQIHSGPPHYSIASFAYAKRMVDLQNGAFNREFGSKFTALIPTSVYGPYDNFVGDDASIIPGLIHKFYVAQKTKRPVVVSGTGRTSRQFVFSHDIARLFMWALRHYESPEAILATCDEAEEASIADVVQIIAESMDFKGEIFFDPMQPEGQIKQTASNARLRRYLPDFKFTPLREGIKKTVDWFLANPDPFRAST